MNQKKSKSTQNKSKDYLTLSIKPEAINNICFSVADEIYEKDLVKKEQYRQQRFEHGFDDTETWHMDRTMALFMIPRLKRFLEVNNGIPNGETEESYDEKLNFILNSFKEYYFNEDQEVSLEIEKERLSNAKKAAVLLGELWFDLWW